MNITKKNAENYWIKSSHHIDTFILQNNYFRAIYWLKISDQDRKTII